MEGGINFSQLEYLQAKYVGTGHADTTGEEWLETQQKDTYASFVGHPNLLKYVSIGLGDSSTARTRLTLIHKMLIPMVPQPDSEPKFTPDMLITIPQPISDKEEPQRTSPVTTINHASHDNVNDQAHDEEEDMELG